MNNAMKDFQCDSNATYMREKGCHESLRDYIHMVGSKISVFDMSNFFACNSLARYRSNKLCPKALLEQHLSRMNKILPKN